MRGGFASVAAASIAIAAPVWAGEAEDLAFASQRGADLFDYDRAAWVASDALMADLKEMPRGKPYGWVVTPSGAGGLEVSFLADDEGRIYRFYAASVRDHKVVASLFLKGEHQTLTEAQLAMARARDVAIEAVRPVCQPQPYNTVVLPGRSGGGAIDVYLLTPQMEAGAYPVGGHTRVTVGADGTIVAQHAFLNTCLTVDERQLPEGASNPIIGVSHLNDPLPTEIHVFLSIWMQAPILVAVAEPERSWMVQGTTIRPFDAK